MSREAHAQLAAVNTVQIVVCRPKLDTDQGFEILAWLKDEQVCLTRASTTFSD